MRGAFGAVGTVVLAYIRVRWAHPGPLRGG